MTKFYDLESAAIVAGEIVAGWSADDLAEFIARYTGKPATVCDDMGERVTCSPGGRAVWQDCETPGATCAPVDYLWPDLERGNE